MLTIELDATRWNSARDFYSAILSALGAPNWHGNNANALIESMVWGGINKIDPPYTIRIFGTANLPTKARHEIELVKHALLEACADFRKQEGRDAVIRFESYP